MLTQFADKTAKSKFTFGKNDNGKGKHTRSVKRLPSSFEKKIRKKK
jgi:hypothetical protein